MNQRVWTQVIVPLLLLGMCSGGCAAMQQQEKIKTERLLVEAGFRTIPATTPEQLAQLKAMPAFTLVKRAKNGQTFYTYADPQSCQCLYVGSTDQYAEYKHYLSQTNIAEDDRLNEMMATEEQARTLDMWDPLF
jgi:hypothetical protein